ncbi:protein zwilch homolog [Neopelma chrysocephalum]|uniref:protein zwilch homolog n=1 Tax=Neopelma chrysocephalum TaxID=114329 RepID=UPI000FCCF7E4|nr:protein zwilch homolog [Neopelma chrysocephalum]XP_027543969.1 protein zwilch homolog [Neopelma chrysocephalum]
MAERRQRAAIVLGELLRRMYEEGRESVPECPYLYETDVEISLVGGSCKSPVERFWNGSSTVYILQKARHTEEGDSMEESNQDEALSPSELLPKESSGPAALSVGRAKQLVSLYAMVQNPNMTHLGTRDLVLPPLWIRCDGSDPEHTCWIGAEPLRAGKKITGITIYMVSCDGPTADETCFANLEELKMEHKRRHHSSVVTTKGFAQYELIQVAAIEDTIVESGSNIYVDITWNIVDKILETPPLISAATLNIALESGDPRSPVYQVYRELQLLLALAEGLKTGVTEWPEPLESESAVELVQEFLTDLKKKLDGDYGSGSKAETEKIKCDTAAVDSYIKSIFSERGDLDFAEQLWCKMRSVSSYQELIDCFTRVIKSLDRGEIQPWIHQGSSSFLRKLIQQSYHGKMEVVSLSGITPIQMLFEIGLDKMKKDYVSFFIGQELATLTYLDYFTSTSVDLQEQVHRVQKLHHMLEIMVNCRVLLQFRHENLFPLTQICMKYYKENPLNEKHVFQLPIRPALVKKFYQNEHPELWKVEISSGHGAKEVKTMWQVSTNPPVEHVASNNSGLFSDSTVNGSPEERLYFITVTKCSQVHFT